MNDKAVCKKCGFVYLLEYGLECPACILSARTRRLTKRAIRESRLEATRLMAMAQCGVEYGTDGYRMLQHAIWQILSDLHLEKL